MVRRGVREPGSADQNLIALRVHTGLRMAKHDYF